MNTPTTLSTRSGLTVEVRPATPEDETALVDFFAGVSDADRRFRFLSAAPQVSDSQIDPLLHADHQNSESYLGYDSANGELIASALLASDSSRETGEIAVSIRSDYRNKGVGWALLDFLGKEAQQRGLKKVIAIESRDNHAAIELEREKGFVPEHFDDDPSLVVLTKSF